MTGGVASSLGKGLTASSLGHLLRARGLRVTMQKLDPYLNVDPGTMNPFQHGEVFVTDDGAETDLDIGHYERFLDVHLQGSANVTTGQIYNRVIARERRGEYLGDTVQVIPHITNEIKARMRATATGDKDAPDVIITEIGGTVGDIESLPFLEAARQVRHDVGRDNVFFLHVSLVPYLAPSGELKTKPTQHSVAALRQVGIQPDGLVLRADREIPDGIKRKISLMCDVDTAAVRRGRRRPEHLRHPEGPPPGGPRRLRHPPAGTAVPRRGLARLGPDAPAGPRPRARRRDRVGGQVHRPARRIPLRHRGHAGRWVPAQRQGAHPLGGQRRVPDRRRRPEGARRRRRRPRPGRVRRAWHRGQGRGDPVGARASGAHAGDLPRPPVHGDRVCAERRRHRRGLVVGVRPGDAGAGHRDDGGAEGVRRGRRRPRRHDATRALPRAASPRAASSPRPTG